MFVFAFALHVVIIGLGLGQNQILDYLCLNTSIKILERYFRND